MVLGRDSIANSLENGFQKIERVYLYESAQTYYLIGSDHTENQFRILRLDRTIVKPTGGLSQILRDDHVVYNKIELTELLDLLNDGNANSGGLTKVASGYGVVGFIKFLDCFYITIIIQRKLVGSIGTNNIYTITQTETFPIRPKDPTEGGANVFSKMWTSINRRFTQTSVETSESRYLSLFQFVDLSKDFFFSYSYDLTRSLQHNYLVAVKKQCDRAAPTPAHNNNNNNSTNTNTTDSEPQEMFEWNHYQTEELKRIVSHQGWVLPLIHGSYQQRRFSLFGRPLDIVLLARRSRHYAGTRYLKRGINNHGKVANDVEVEQIIQIDGGRQVRYCSYLQMRGSIPTYWAQETSVTMPKPPIQVSRRDASYRATQEHFSDLIHRYNMPILVLDLVKQQEKKPREMIIGQEFREAIDEINCTVPLHKQIWYFALDYTRISKSKKQAGFAEAPRTRQGSVSEKRTAVGQEWDLIESSITDGSKQITTQQQQQQQQQQQPIVPLSPSSASVRLDVLQELGDISSVAIAKTGMFCNSVAFLSQVGSLSDSVVTEARNTGFLIQRGVLRTNCVDCLDRTNVAQFAMGMKFLAVSLRALGLTDRYASDPSSPLLMALMDMYSELGDRIALQYGGSEANKRVSVGNEPVKQGELITSIRRYYNNAFTDNVKQDAINVFLGNYIPSEKRIPLWDLESDYYLHNKCLRPPTSFVDKLLYSDLTRRDGFADETPGHFDGAQVKELILRLPSSAFDLREDLFQRYLIHPHTHNNANEQQQQQQQQLTSLDSLPVELHRNLVRSERRKHVSSIMRRRVRQALEQWWRQSKQQHQAILLDAIAALSSAPIPRKHSSKQQQTAENYFVRQYQPEELTFFDEALSADFLGSMDNQTSLALQWGSRKQRGNTNSVSGGSGGNNNSNNKGGGARSQGVALGRTIVENNDTYARNNSMDSGDDNDNNNDRDDSADGTGVKQENSSMSYLFSAFGGHFQNNNNTEKESDSVATRTITLSKSREDSIASQQQQQQMRSSFQLGKYVREIGQKARTLVDGLLRRENNFNNNEQLQGGPQTHHSKRESSHLSPSLNMGKAFIPDNSMNLYKQYANIANDNMILFHSHNQVSEEDFKIALRDFTIDADNVRAMEQLSSEYGIHSVVPEGMNEGAAFSDSATQAALFLAQSINFVENDLMMLSFNDNNNNNNNNNGKKGNDNSVMEMEQSQALMMLSATKSPKSGNNNNNETHRKTISLRSSVTPSLTMGAISIPPHVLSTLSDLCRRHQVHHGLYNELHRAAFRFLLQQTMYAREMSFERLSKRLSNMTSERSIFNYLSLVEEDSLISDIDTIVLMTLDANPSQTFDDLEQHLNKYFFEHVKYNNKKQTILEKVLLAEESNTQQNERKNINKNNKKKKLTVTTSDRVADSDDEIVDDDVNNVDDEDESDDDGSTDEEERSSGRKCSNEDDRLFPGVVLLEPNHYARRSNPFLLMNEIAAMGLSKVLYSSHH